MNEFYNKQNLKPHISEINNPYFNISAEIFGPNINYEFLYFYNSFIHLIL